MGPKIVNHSQMVFDKMYEIFFGNNKYHGFCKIHYGCDRRCGYCTNCSVSTREIKDCLVNNNSCDGCRKTKSFTDLKFRKNLNDDEYFFFGANDIFISNHGRILKITREYKDLKCPSQVIVRDNGPVGVYYQEPFTKIDEDCCHIILQSGFGNELLKKSIDDLKQIINLLAGIEKESLDLKERETSFETKKTNHAKLEKEYGMELEKFNTLKLRVENMEFKNIEDLKTEEDKVDILKEKLVIISKNLQIKDEAVKGKIERYESINLKGFDL